MDVYYEAIDLTKFGHCLKVHNGTIECLISLDYGPRILKFGYLDEENLLYDQSNTVVNSQWGTWNLIGGHRLAHSPEQVPRTYVPDNEQVSFEKINQGVRLIQKQEPWVQVEKKLEVIFEEGNRLKVVHYLTNKNAWPIEAALWGITLVKPGGIEMIPLSHQATGPLPNRNLVLWPYTDINDSRLTLHNDYIMLQHDTTIQKPLKLGINNDQGWIAYLINKYLFIKRFDVVTEGHYPDRGVNYETYANGDALELESLSPLQRIDCEQTIHHTETWEIIRGIPNDIKGVIDQYI